MSNSITIRNVEDRDFGALAALRRDAALQDLLMGYPAADVVSDEDVTAWIRRWAECRHGCFFSVVNSADSAIGFVQLTNIHWKGRHAYFGVAILESARGARCGLAAVEAIVEHARSSFGARKILAEVRADNRSSHRMCREAGFVEAGILRRHYLGHDVTLYERLLDE